MTSLCKTRAAVIETGRLRHDGLYRFLATWSDAGAAERTRLYSCALASLPDVCVRRAPDLSASHDASTVAVVQVTTVLLAAHLNDSTVLKQLDAIVAPATVSPPLDSTMRAALASFVVTRLPHLVNALHQGELTVDGGELHHFSAAALHAWMCEV